MADDVALEPRTVEVNDPSLSDEANVIMTRAVREIVGADTVRVPADRPRPSQGDRPRGNPFERITATTAMMLGMVAVGAGVGMVVAMIDHRWWTTGVAFFVLLVALTAVTVTIFSLASTTDYADPNTVAALSELGVSDIEPRLSEIVREFTPLDGLPEEAEHRTVAVEDDPVAAAAQHRAAMTPSGGPSTSVGPGT